MFQSIYYIDKASNTFADNLAAFGLAFILSSISDGRAGVRIEDRGAVFAVVCEPAIREQWVQECPFFVGASFVITLDNKTAQKVIKGTTLAARSFANAEGGVAVDYEKEKRNAQDFFAWRKSLSPEDRRRAANGDLRPPAAPHPDWDVFRAVNPAALQGYNALMAEWRRGKDAFPELLQALLRMTAQTPNDLKGAEKTWAKTCKEHKWESPKEATALQLLNPTQGKGVNSEKMTWSAPNNVKGFWLLEWLKAVGLFRAGITRTVANPSDPRNAKDRKTYVLMPVYLEWGVHERVMKDFRQAMTGSATAVKLDVLAGLRYTEALLKHYEQARADDAEMELFNRRPSDLVKGMQTAFYKSLGQSPAVMNIAAINLPRWVAPRTPNDLAALKDALDEHVSIIRTLDETRGDQFELLRHYRDFMSADDLAPFFEFTNAYSGFITSQRERRKPARQFTTTTMEVIFMNSGNPKYSKIVHSKGFKDIAYAIRQATVTAQYRKANKDKFQVRYDVRYGLGQQLARKANYPADFLAELNKFLFEYNAETSQEYENVTGRYKGVVPDGIRRQMRRRLETNAIDELTQLLEEFGNDSKLICNMLVAYGYAREPYEDKGDEKLAEDAEPETAASANENEDGE